MPAAIILVHGSQHGSWCWDRVVDGLTARGIPAVAVDLPGRGVNAGRPVTPSEAVAVIEEAISEQDGKVVLCGHSAAGLPVSVVAARNPAVGHLIYLSAILPMGDEVMKGVTEELITLAAPHMHFEDGLVKPGSFEQSWAVNYNDCTEEDARWAFARLIAEPMGEPTDMPADFLTATPWERVPVTYAIGREDRAIPLHLQRRLAARAHHVVEWPTGHSPFLSKPELVIALLEARSKELR